MSSKCEVTNIQQLPEWASLEQLAPIVAIRDRRTFDKLPIRKVRLSSRVVRYNSIDLKNLIAKRTTGKEVVAS